jgi:hypothetical protein
MQAATYRILDEPRPTGLGHLATNPVWPMLALMLAGPWLALPWFALNAFATGSATRWRELGGVLAFAPVTLLLSALLGLAVQRALVPAWSPPYLWMLVSVWKLGLGYWLLTLQQQGFALHAYFGGVQRNGAPLLVAGVLLDARVQGLLAGSRLLQVLLS